MRIFHKNNSFCYPGRCYPRILLFQPAPLRSFEQLSPYFIFIYLHYHCNITIIIIHIILIIIIIIIINPDSDLDFPYGNCINCQRLDLIIFQMILIIVIIVISTIKIIVIIVISTIKIIKIMIIIILEQAYQECKDRQDLKVVIMRIIIRRITEIMIS